MRGLGELKEKIVSLETDLGLRVEELDNEKAVEAFRIEYLGRKGRVSQLFKTLPEFDVCLLYTSPSPRDRS